MNLLEIEKVGDPNEVQLDRENMQMYVPDCHASFPSLKMNLHRRHQI